VISTDNLSWKKQKACKKSIMKLCICVLYQKDNKFRVSNIN
jgi:hypothetical protein